MEGGTKKRKVVPYTNLPTSGFGKIVMKKYVELQESAGPVVNCKPIKIPVSVSYLVYLGMVCQQTESVEERLFFQGSLVFRNSITKLFF